MSVVVGYEAFKVGFFENTALGTVRMGHSFLRYVGGSLVFDIQRVVKKWTLNDREGI